MAQIIKLDIDDVDFADYSSEDALRQWGNEREFHYIGLENRQFWCHSLSTYMRSAIGLCRHTYDGLWREFYWEDDAVIEITAELKAKHIEVAKAQDNLHHQIVRSKGKPRKIYAPISVMKSIIREIDATRMKHWGETWR